MQGSGFAENGVTKTGQVPLFVKPNPFLFFADPDWQTQTGKNSGKKWKIPSVGILSGARRGTLALVGVRRDANRTSEHLCGSLYSGERQVFA